MIQITALGEGQQTIRLKQINNKPFLLTSLELKAVFARATFISSSGKSIVIEDNPD
eukprot:Pgem_evm1s16896